jgi:hypothetical protein
MCIRLGDGFARYWHDVVVGLTRVARSTPPFLSRSLARRRGLSRHSMLSRCVGRILPRCTNSADLKVRKRLQGWDMGNRGKPTARICSDNPHADLVSVEREIPHLIGSMFPGRSQGQAKPCITGLRLRFGIRYFPMGRRLSPAQVWRRAGSSEAALRFLVEVRR